MAFFETRIPDRARKPGAGIEPVERIAVEQVGLTLGANQILEEVSFVLEKGRSYGFVGASGSGKSSLTFMLCGLYKADKGHIYFNGKDTKDLGVYALCDQVGLVRSNTKLLRGTIRDNILYGIESAGADSTAGDSHGEEVQALQGQGETWPLRQRTRNRPPGQNARCDERRVLQDV